MRIGGCRTREKLLDTNVGDRYFAQVCSSWWCCAAVGRLGFDQMRQYRRPVMIFLVVLGCILQTFAIVAVVGVSSDSTNVKNCPWATYRGVAVYNGAPVEFKAYINLKYFRVESLGYHETFSLDDAKDAVENENNPFAKEVKDCSEASKDVVLMVWFLAISHPFTILSVYFRISMDNGCKKVDAITSAAILNALFALWPVVKFSNKCYNDIPDSSDPQLGVGYVLTLLYCLITLFVMLPLLCIVPSPEVPEELRGDLEESEGLTLTGKDPVFASYTEPNLEFRKDPVNQKIEKNDYTPI